MRTLSVFVEVDSLMPMLLEKLEKTGDVVIQNKICNSDDVEIQISASDFAWELLTAMSEADVVF